MHDPLTQVTRNKLVTALEGNSITLWTDYIDHISSFPQLDCSVDLTVNECDEEM